MKTPVRASRAYLAGFGTSGSLIAGAVLLFLLGSAIVAFRGWPEIATGPATSAVAGPQLLSAAHLTHRPAASHGLRGAGSAGRRHGGFGTRAPAHRSGRARGTVLAGGGSKPALPSAPGGSSAAVQRPSPCGTGGCSSPASPNLISHVANVVADSVSSAGAGVGSVARGSTAAAARSVSGISPQAAGIVASGGSTAGTTVSDTTTTAAGAVSAAGNALGGGH